MSPTMRTSREIGAGKLRFRRSRRRRGGAPGRRPKRRRRLGVALRLVAWPLAIACLVVSLFARFPPDSETTLAHYANVASSFVAPLFVVAASLALLTLALRFWACLVVATASLVVCGWAVLSVPRQHSTGAPTVGQIPVRVLHWNVRHSNRDPEPLVELLVRHEPDVVILLETFGSMHVALREDPRIGSRYPYRLTPRNVGKGMRVILSKHPLRGADDWSPPDRAEGPAYAIAEMHGVSVGLMAIHPLSPRTPENAATGRRSVRASATLLDERFGPTTPVVLGADLNASPTSARARSLYESTSLRPSKPLVRFDGTWPAGVAGPLRVAIDDVWTRGPFRVIEWTTLDTAGGSDHRPVLVDLALDLSP